MLLMPSEDLVQSSWKVQSSNRSFILDTSRKTWKLTWPKNRKGKRNVSPLHIQDWNPSAETEKQSHSHVLFCFVGVLSLWFHCSTAWRLRCLRKQICVIGAPACWDICTLHADVNNCPHLSPFPPISPTQTWCCRWLKQLKWFIKNSLPTVRSSWFLSPKARSLYKQPLW